jgi:hypothetical protein
MMMHQANAWPTIRLSWSTPYMIRMNMRGPPTRNWGGPKGAAPT